MSDQKVYKKNTLADNAPSVGSREDDVHEGAYAAKDLWANAGAWKGGSAVRGELAHRNTAVEG